MLLCLFQGLVAGLRRRRPRKQIEQSSSSGKFCERHSYLIKKFFCLTKLIFDFTLPSSAPPHTSKDKGVGPGPTLAWPGWKQPDIPVEVDTGRLETEVGRSFKEIELSRLS